LAGLRSPVGCPRNASEAPRAVAANLGPHAASICVCRDHLAGCVVCDLLAAGRERRLYRFRTAIPNQAAGQLLALALVAMGVLLRPKALLAAPILAAYVVWPTQSSLRRTAILFVPAVVGFFAVVQVVYYGALGATRQHPSQSIMIFDLGGISHFAKASQYSVDWNDLENALLLNTCYQPTQWDIYWRLEPCDFVMGKIEREKSLFGTSAIPKAWLLAILQHPSAYLQHRLAFMWNFLAADNLTMWLVDVEHPTQQVFPDRATFAVLVSVHDVLKSTPLLRAGSWLLACIALCGFSRHEAARAKAPSCWVSAGPQRST
jgi:hypothetical protein